MDHNQISLTKMLSAAIRGKTVEEEFVKNVDWKVIYQTAKEQEVATVIYPVVKQLGSKNLTEEDIMDKWKKSTIMGALWQKRSLEKFGKTLEQLNKAGIQVMALKGLMLRDLYPTKDLRGMTDVDILIHSEDLDKAERLLLELGYAEDHRDLKHILFLKKDNIPIEVHWLLVDLFYFKKASEFEKAVWENTKPYEFLGNKMVVASLENNILHLCLHMAVHFAYSGFGLRQLCDLVILVEKNEGNIDWKAFLEKVDKTNLNNFVIAIFDVCRRLLDFNVPNILKNHDSSNDIYIDMIIQSIFFGGVYEGNLGKTRFAHVDGELLEFYENNNVNNNLTEKVKYFLKFFFPLPSKLSKRYTYAKKIPIFLPVAWGHRIAYGIFRKDFDNEKKGMFLLGNSDLIKERMNLFKWLGL